MFASLKQMAKIDGELGEDKGQLNYHVILIGMNFAILSGRHAHTVCREHASFHRRHSPTEDQCIWSFQATGRNHI